MKALRTLRRSLYSLAPWVVFCAFLSAQQHSYQEDERQRKAIVKALLEAAMDEDEDEEEEGKWVGLVKEEDQ